MAHESFEDEEVARILNASFVSVKVDREERPDIDEVYMNVCQAMTGSGGWPLTIIMTPEKKPFLAGTYFPKDDAYGRVGLLGLLPKIAGMWSENREELIHDGEEITRILSGRTERKREGADPERVIGGAYRHMQNSFDASYGGFSKSPKFPTPHNLLFLLKYWRAYGDFDALDMAEKTLSCMYRGGIFDHVGWGFSRYSTDRKWLVPHFEKMLYDNALLMLAYTECFAATGSSVYREIAEKTAEYLMRDMRLPEGAFYSAQDADSEGVEGKYYVWEYDELKTLLSGDELKALEEHYGVTKQGNFEGVNILNTIYAKQQGGESADAVLKKLYDERLKRTPPLTDTKVLAAWNGFAIEAFARAGAVFAKREYTDCARQAADFILGSMKDEHGLYSTYMQGTHSKQGFLADYANFGNALTALYEATLELKYLKEAVSLAGDMLRMFWDDKDSRFYMTGKGEEELFMRPRDEYDGAMPSGSSAAVTLLLRLYNLTDADWARQALDNAIEGLLPNAAESPASCVHFVSALLAMGKPHRQVIIAADSGSSEAKQAYTEIVSRFLPFTTAIYYDKSAEMDEVFPELRQYKTDTPFAGYVCENFTCKKPVYSPEELLRELGL